MRIRTYYCAIPDGDTRIQTGVGSEKSKSANAAATANVRSRANLRVIFKHTMMPHGRMRVDDDVHANTGFRAYHTTGGQVATFPDGGVSGDNS